MILIILKAFHVVFIVTWFAGLFYMPRLFVYQTEANDKPEPDRSILLAQFRVMARRLWLWITWPSTLLAIFFGLGIMSPYFQSVWFWIKMALVLLLLIYQVILHMTYRSLQRDQFKYSSHQLRLMNEISTIFLFAIVFLAVLKDAINYFVLISGLVALGVLIYVGVRAYRRMKNQQKPKPE